MAIEQHHAIAAERLLAALQEYNDIESEQGGIVVDFMVAYTIQKIDDEGDLTWQNNWVANPGVGPNAHLGLSTWMARSMNDMIAETD